MIAPTVIAQASVGFAMFGLPSTEEHDYFERSSATPSNYHHAFLFVRSGTNSLCVLPSPSALDAAISGARYSIQSKTSSDVVSQVETEAYESARAEAAKQIASLTALWKRSLLDPSAESNAKSLAYTTKLVYESLYKLGPSSIDLRNLEHTRVSPLHLAVILRVTKARKQSVPGWDHALSIAKQVFSSYGPNYGHALVGLC
jgi:hypothetical protein